ANAFADCAHAEEKRSGKVLRLRPESLFEKFVRGQQISTKISRNEDQGNDYARDDVAKHNLQIGEVAALLRSRVIRISNRRNPDERYGAGLSRDYRKADDDPVSILCADEIVFDGSLRFAKHHAESRDAREV